MSYQNFLGYAGDILATDAYALLAGDSTSVLIDVRTQAELTYVGAPDIQSLGKTPLFLEWQSYPSMAVDPNFTAALEALLQSGGVERGASLVFLCRSGARSRCAATAMTSAGWAPCFNVSDGFEGPLGDSRRRGEVSGWKAGGFPWTQT
ncbi:MAG TPA: rhodanese-like domain-containing protein [Roseiarcus sp.]|jgi:rhodanese-related sulfurtransferase